METRTAICLLFAVMVTPAAAAEPILPAACHESLVGCLDAVSPRSTPSNALPASLQPEPAAQTATAPETAPPAAAPPEASPEVAPAVAPEAAPGPAPAPAAPPASDEPAFEVEPANTDADVAAPAPRPLVAPGTLGVFIGAATLAILLIGIVIIAVVEIRSRRLRGNRTTLAAAARADAMQRDIEQAWRNARHG